MVDLTMFVGVSGSGKSTVAADLSRDTGAEMARGNLDNNLFKGWPKC